MLFKKQLFSLSYFYGQRMKILHICHKCIKPFSGLLFKM